MKNEGVIDLNGRLEFQRILESDIDTVWRFLVEEKLRSRWLCQGIVECYPRGKIEFKFDPQSFGRTRPPNIPTDHLKAEIEGTVIACDPPRKLVFSWPGENEETTTHVTITLETIADRTLLTLVHERLTNPAHLTDAATGWHAHLEQLECCLSRQLSPNFWDRHKELNDRYKVQVQEAGSQHTHIPPKQKIH